jgi:hypothetical protein
VTRAGALAVLALPWVGSCATAPREPWVLSSEGLSARPARDLESLSAYPEALATTLEVLQEDLRLPPVPVKLLFVPDAGRMRAILLEIGYPPRLAREVSREMTAIGGHRVVLINQARLEGQGWPGRVSTLAHELGHVLEYELAGGPRGTSAQWVREGFSEWVEARVLETLGGEEEGTAWSQALARVRSPDRVLTLGRPGWAERVPPARPPALGALGSFPEWVRHLRGVSGGALYDYAFLAVASLVETHGVPAVLRYFELSATAEDPAANFLEAFGESEAQFEERLRSLVWP